MIGSAVIDDVAKGRWVSAVKLGVLAVSVAAAIPTARDLYFSWQNGIPFSQVQHRLNQASLLEKNFGCQIDYRTLTTLEHGRVDVGSCTKTGDISIRVSAKTGQVNYEWIAFNQLPKAARQTAGLMDLLISPAQAAPAPGASALPGQSPGQNSGIIRVADEVVEVMCQVKRKDVIVRVIKDKGKCVRESVSLFRGTVEKREDIPCDKACPLPS
jgi:hypothetical protein